MPVRAGEMLGPYEVTGLLGTGGMGEVYRARDTTLGRDVAIKVLREELSRDEERLARFEREAKVLAQLNHPNIATLHAFENGYLVMELVEGETLSDRIARGAIPLDEAVPLFLQIAEGLEAAHEKNVVHRDLKPGNVMVTEGDRLKILDFGLAKAFSANDDVSTETSRSPTLTRGTALGAILGTASYMSPEQARGETVDKRSDVWAFGCCLYEALTGRKAFPGETVSDIIGGVLRAEPDWEMLPATMRTLVKRCLVKDSRQRLRDIGEARIALETRDAEPSPAADGKSAVPWAIASVLALALVASWLTRAPSGASKSAVGRFVVVPTTMEQLSSDQAYPLALSPDGAGLAYTARRGDRVELYVRRFDRLAASPLDDTDGAALPFFSPDGGWLGYFARGKLWKVRVEGGVPVALADTTSGVGAAWGDDGHIYFSAGSGVLRIPASGGTPEAITRPEGASHRVVAVLPGARALVYRTVPGVSRFSTSAPAATSPRSR